MPSFLNPSPRPQGVLKVEPILQCKAEDEATLSQPATREEKEEEEKGKVVKMLNSEDESDDDFEVFNQPESPEVPVGDFSHLPSAQVSQTQGYPSILEAMGIQCKPRTSLLEVMKSQTGGKAPEKTTQAKLPPLSPT